MTVDNAIVAERIRLFKAEWKAITARHDARYGPAPKRRGGRKPRTTRPRYKILTAGDWAATAGFDTCEPKYDGCYAELRGNANANGWTLRSRGGHLLKEGNEALPVCHLLVEHMTTTEWSIESGFYGSLIAWGALGARGKHLRRETLERLVRTINDRGVDLNLSEQFPASEAPSVWSEMVEDIGYEGLVFKTADGAHAKMKRVVTHDFVCMGTDNGSVIGGLYNSRSQLLEKVRVRHPGPVTVGRVFEASGFSVTWNESLRSPHWSRWRDDKPAGECTTGQ